MVNAAALRVVRRTLGRHRSFTAVAVLSLAIAIALNTTMYSVLDAMLYPEIHVRKPENIYHMRYFGDRYRRLPKGAVEEGLRAAFAHYEMISGAEGFFYYVGKSPLAEHGPRYARVHPTVVRANFFDFLGTPALQGRTFIAADTLEDNRPAVISDRLTRQLFPDQSPVGQTLTLDGDPYTVVGVVQRTSSFDLLSGDLWIIPTRAQAAVGPTLIRFHDHVVPGMVEAELKVVAARLAIAAGEAPGSTRFYGEGFTTGQFTVGPFHLALIAAVLAVLLVACANLANLQLARGLARSRELAVRAAVGASRRQLIAHLLLESAVLAAIGLALGIVATVWAVRGARDLIPPVMNQYIIEPQVSWRVFAFAAGAAVLCVLLVGLIPAVRVSRVDPEMLLKSGAGTGANREHRRRYGYMIVAQIAFALPVLIGSFVLVQNAVRWGSSDFLIRTMYGYDPSHIVVSQLRVPLDSSRATLADVDAELQARAQEVPGAVSSTVDVRGVPVRSPGTVVPYILVDDVDGSVRQVTAPQWSYHVVSPGYFRTFGRTIVFGRDFLDGERGSDVVVIDSLTAAFLWHRENPIGRVIKLGGERSSEPWRKVVGVVGDLRDTASIRHLDVTAGNSLGGVYRLVTPGDTLRQRWKDVRLAFVTLYARYSGNTELAAVRLQRELRTLSVADKPGVEPLESEYGSSYERTQRDFVSFLFTVFALIGVSLVAVGMYGIVAHSVEERRREIAVRISLGAQARDILRALLREGNILLLIGVAVGLLLIRKTVWWLGNFIGEDDGYNALGFAAIAAILFVVAVIGALIPALRATKIDPADALRSE